MSFRPPLPRAKPAKVRKPLPKPKAGPALTSKTPPKAPAKPCQLAVWWSAGGRRAMPAGPLAD
jgi:hypothetical protein